MKQPNRFVSLLLPLCFWLLVWVLLAFLVGQELLLPSPVRVLETLGGLVVTASFWETLAVSFLRVLAGIFAAVLLGIVLAVLCVGSKTADLLIRPLMTVIKSTPIASFIVLALLWLGRRILPAFIAGLMVLPVVWANVTTGIRQTDRALLEMAKVYRLPRLRILSRIYIPSVLPYFRSALLSALGFGWKAGVTAEVLTVPNPSIGRMISDAKLYLQTPELFAWTVAIVVLSLLIEKLMLRFVGGIGQKGGAQNAEA